MGFRLPSDDFRKPEDHPTIFLFPELSDVGPHGITTVAMGHNLGPQFNTHDLEAVVMLSAAIIVRNYGMANVADCLDKVVVQLGHLSVQVDDLLKGIESL